MDPWVRLEKLMLDVNSAVQDMLTKSEEDIQKEAGNTWAARACACYLLAGKAYSPKERLRWLLRAEDNRHEAIEHSALVEDGGVFTNAIQKEIEPYRKAALK
jgi:hypothetical protein